MENADRLALASESCHVAAFALAGGNLQLAALALKDAEKVLRLQAVEEPSLPPEALQGL
jgi:hypothetical protein